MIQLQKWLAQLGTYAEFPALEKYSDKGLENMLLVGYHSKDQNFKIQKEVTFTNQMRKKMIYALIYKTVGHLSIGQNPCSPLDFLPFVVCGVDWE